MQGQKPDPFLGPVKADLQGFCINLQPVQKEIILTLGRRYSTRMKVGTNGKISRNSFRLANSKEQAPYDNPAAGWRELREILIRLASGSLRTFSKKSRKSEAEVMLKKLLDKVVWAYTEAPGKYRGNPIWSIGANRSYKKWNSRCWKSSKKNKRLVIPDDDRLVHEHVVPRKFVVSKLLNMANPTERKIGSLLRKFALAAVVTRKENRKLHRHGNDSKVFERDPWIRYKNAKIRIVNHSRMPLQVRLAHPELLT